MLLPFNFSRQGRRYKNADCKRSLRNKRTIILNPICRTGRIGVNVTVLAAVVLTAIVEKHNRRSVIKELRRRPVVIGSFFWFGSFGCGVFATQKLQDKNRKFLFESLVLNQAVK